jgi:hypothetical protein
MDLIKPFIIDFIVNDIDIYLTRPAHTGAVLLVH